MKEKEIGKERENEIDQRGTEKEIEDGHQQDRVLLEVGKEIATVTEKGIEIASVKETGDLDMAGKILACCLNLQTNF